MFITLNYHMLVTFSTILKKHFGNCGKNFVKKILTLSFHTKILIFNKIFLYKNTIFVDLKSFLVCKFICASCSCRYNGETCCHFKTSVERITGIIFSNICSKIKEALHINWRKPNLNAQQNYFALTLSLQLASPLWSFLCLFLFPFSFIYYFHYLWHLSSASFIVLTKLNYYFISLRHTLYHIFPFHLSIIRDTNYWHLLLS